MSIILPFMFALAAVLAIATIWNAVASNLDAIADLRRKVGLPDCGSEIVVNLLDTEPGINPVSAMRRARHLRHPLPKPVTHRLHHFVKARTAA